MIVVGLKTIVNALIESFISLRDVTLLSSFILSIFALVWDREKIYSIRCYFDYRSDYNFIWAFFDKNVCRLMNLFQIVPIFPVLDLICHIYPIWKKLIIQVCCEVFLLRGNEEIFDKVISRKNSENKSD